MMNVLLLLNYCIQLILHPIATATRIVRERNPKISYFAVWLALISIIVYMALFSTTAQTQMENHGVSHQVAVTSDAVGIFLMAPIAFFLGRFIFIAATKGGLRLIGRKSYPKQPQERQSASDTLKMVYPYIYVPMGFQMLLQLLFYPLASPISGCLQLLTFVYMIVLQVVFIKRIYGVSGVVAFFSPMIVWWLILLIFWLILFVTTGSIFVLSNYT